MKPRGGRASTGQVRVGGLSESQYTQGKRLRNDGKGTDRDRHRLTAPTVRCRVRLGFQGSCGGEEREGGGLGWGEGGDAASNAD